MSNDEVEMFKLRSRGPGGRAQVSNHGSVMASGFCISLLLLIVTYGSPLNLVSSLLSGGAAKTTKEDSVLAVVVLGGGLRADGTVPTWVENRCAKAAQIYLREKEKIMNGKSEKYTGIRIITTSLGTPYKPNPRDERGFMYREGSSSTLYLHKTLGVMLEDIYEEIYSLDTIGNAYFTRMLHLDPMPHVKDVVLVTNNWHMPRAKEIFQFVLTLTFHGGANKVYNIQYVDVDAGMEDEVLKARAEKELKSLQQWRGTAAKIVDVHTLHSFMFMEHMAYSSKRHNAAANGDVSASSTDRNATWIDPVVFKSY